MTDSIFEIGADGVDTDKIVDEISAEVARKRAAGVYNKAKEAYAQSVNLSDIKNDDEFLAFFLKYLREAVFVDINDFEILERRSSGVGILIGIKKVIWKMLKFYTYRLWSQQNQVNGIFLSALEEMESRYEKKIKVLEDRITELEGKGT